MDASFKLDDLLKLELHKFADEVGEIVDCAQKEEKMEQGLAKLKVMVLIVLHIELACPSCWCLLCSLKTGESFASKALCITECCPAALNQSDDSNHGMPSYVIAVTLMYD